MGRSISIYRRRPGIVETSIRVRPDVTSYKYEASANFYGETWYNFDTIPACGKNSKSVVVPGMYDGQYRGLTHFSFAPSDYTATYPVVDDAKPFWIRVTPYIGAVAGTTEAAQLILPYSSIPNRAFNIHGTVGTAVVEIVLPTDVSSSTFMVEGSESLFIAYEPFGTEYRIPGLTLNSMDVSSSFPTFNSLFVRGTGSATEFYASFRLLNNRAM